MEQNGKTALKVSKKILILGASGMLGSTMIRLFAESEHFDVTGAVRSASGVRFLPDHLQKSIVSGIDAEDMVSVRKLISNLRPDVVVNCIGLVKQLSDVNDPLVALPINSLFPHKLARCCLELGARVIHLSTDCLFTGRDGFYKETDVADAHDLYGISKRLGEIDYDNAITLRTSIIGHELNGNRSLVSWFLSQEGRVEGYKNAIFSGLPTVEMSRIIRDYVIPNSDLRGVYHVSADPINKFDLLSLVAEIYEKDIKIEGSEGFVIDRSLDSTRFRGLTGYNPPSWRELIMSMKKFG